MNNRQRILSILNGKQPDRVPWFGDLSYWALAFDNNYVDRNYNLDEKFYEYHRKLGCGFYLQGYEPFTPVYDDQININIKNEGNIRIREVETPKGRIEERWQWISDSYCEAPVNYFIEDIGDLRTFASWLEHTSYIPDYDRAQKRYKLIGDNGVVLCYLPKSSFMQLVTTYMGIENLVNIWMKYKNEFEEFIQFMDEKMGEAAAIALDSPAECLMIPENLSSEVVGKKFYNNYVSGFESHWVKKIEEENKYSFIHMDGTLSGLISEVGEIGFTVMEALTPSPVGDLSLAEMEERVPETSIIWGGIPGSYFTNIVDDSEFEKHVKGILNIMSKKPRFVLGVSDQVPPGGLEYRVDWVEDLVEKYGYY